MSPFSWRQNGARQPVLSTIVYAIHHKSVLFASSDIVLVFVIVNPLTVDTHCCHMATAVKHPVPDRVKPSFVNYQPWASECPDVKNYKWRLNPVSHGMLYSCSHMATVGVKGLTIQGYGWRQVNVGTGILGILSVQNSLRWDTVVIILLTSQNFANAHLYHV